MKIAKITHWSLFLLGDPQGLGLSDVAGSCIEKKKQCPNPVRQSPLFSGLQLLWLWRLKPTFYAGSSKFFLGMVARSLDSRLSLTCTSLVRFFLRPLKKTALNSIDLPCLLPLLRNYWSLWTTRQRRGRRLACRAPGSGQKFLESF